MADALCKAILQPTREFYLTDPIEDLSRIDGVMCSGGVAEFVYGRESRDFGDLGQRLGLALQKRLDRLPWKLLPPGECIRATAFGASEYSVQLSGNTVYISQPGELLPRKDLQVLQPPVRLEGPLDADTLAAAIRSHLAAFDVVEGQTEFALAFRWRGEPSFQRLSAFARAIALSLARTIELRKPVYLILDGDVAQTLGAILKDEWGVGSEVLVLDGVALRDFDYIDLGRVRMPSHTVPVSIKSLVFSQDHRERHS
jgi:ethanolamine utilization protein EutA